MTISAKNLPRYFDKLKYPVRVLAHKGPDVIREAFRDELADLAERGVVIGVGSWSNLKYCRLSNSLAVASEGHKPCGETAAIASTYREDGPTYIMKRAGGTRGNFTLNKWPSAASN